MLSNSVLSRNENSLTIVILRRHVTIIVRLNSLQALSYSFVIQFYKQKEKVFQRVTSLNQTCVCLHVYGMSFGFSFAVFLLTCHGLNVAWRLEIRKKHYKYSVIVWQIICFLFDWDNIILKVSLILHTCYCIKSTGVDKTFIF